MSEMAYLFDLNLQLIADAVLMIVAIFVLFLIVERVDDDESEKIPERFVKEGRLADIGLCPALMAELHSCEIKEAFCRGRFAVGFSVKEIAPSSDDLTDHNAGADHIERSLPLDLFVE